MILLQQDVSEGKTPAYSFSKEKRKPDIMNTFYPDIDPGQTQDAHT